MNPSTPYRRGSRTPEHVAAYRMYMKEYMRKWRKGLCKKQIRALHMKEIRKKKLSG